MAGKNRDSNTASAPAWTYYVISVLALTTSLAIAALLFATFWIGRPLDLGPRTQELADRLEIALVENYVPREAITRAAPEPLSTTQGRRTARWTHHDFEVAVPARLTNAGLRDVLARELGPYNAHVTDDDSSPDSPDVERLAIYLDQYKFASIALLTAEREASTAYRSDLRGASLQLAELAAEVLATLGGGGSAMREAAVPREDLNSLWNYTRFTATLPPGVTLGMLKEQLEALIFLPDARVETGEGLDDQVDLRITLSGRPCVGIACTIIPAGAAPRPQAITLDGVLEGGIQGSEPDETMPAREVQIPMTAPDGAAAPEMEDPGPEAAEPVAAPAETPEAPGPRAHGAATKIAIIIDDGGYVRADGDRILALDPRLTLAILPNTPHGAAIAREGAALGFEIMLHMPMEPQSRTEAVVAGTVYTAMDREEIQKLTRDALDQIPEVAGINNHTGSKFTADAEKLGFVFEVLDERNLFFIDSFTMNTSVALQTARAAGIPAARRDVFLDNSGDEASIRRQFDELVAIAVKTGSAIGIGHFQKANTAKVLHEEIPKLKVAGIELVHASELVR